MRTNLSRNDSDHQAAGGHGRTLFPVLALVSLLQTASGQNFTDLDFESATIVPVAGTGIPNLVYASSAVPGWTIQSVYGPNYMFYDALSLGAPSVSLCGPTNNPGYFSPLALDGHYSIDLYGGVPGSGDTSGGSISQTGLVPASARSLEFLAAGTFANGPLHLSLGGQNIPFYALYTGPGYTCYGADVSAFAGHVEELAFTPPFNSGVNNYWELDDIGFSTAIIPEPGISSLFLLGGFLFCSRCMKPGAKPASP